MQFRVTRKTGVNAFAWEEELIPKASFLIYQIATAGGIVYASVASRGVPGSGGHICCFSHHWRPVPGDLFFNDFTPIFWRLSWFHLGSYWGDVGAILGISWGKMGPTGHHKSQHSMQIRTSDLLWFFESTSRQHRRRNANHD
jgi:hypothetical protein